MAYSGKTPNYNLPQIEGTDKVNWFDLNGAFTTIDTGMESNKQEAETANQKADNNTNAIAALTETVNNQGQTGVDNTAEIDRLKQTTSLHTTHLNEIDTINQSQTQRITALENQAAETGTELNSLTNNVADISGTVTTNTNNIANAQTEIEALQSITDSMQEDVENSVRIVPNSTLNFELVDIQVNNGESFPISAKSQKTVVTSANNIKETKVMLKAVVNEGSRVLTMNQGDTIHFTINTSGFNIAGKMSDLRCSVNHTYGIYQFPVLVAHQAVQEGNYIVATDQLKGTTLEPDIIFLEWKFIQ